MRNGVHYAEMWAIFEQVRFTAEVARKATWKVLPIAHSTLGKEFIALPDDNLMAGGFDIVLWHKVCS